VKDIAIFMTLELLLWIQL